MFEWEKQRENERTEEAKRWQHSCGRKDFYSLDQIKKDTYICTQHFIGRKGPTAENPNPITATLTESQVDSLVARSLKRQNSKSRKRNAMPELEMAAAKRKINCESLEESVVLLDENPRDSGSRHDSDIEAEKEGSSPSHCDKETQTVYSKYELGAKVENMVLRNEMKIFGSSSMNTDVQTCPQLMECEAILKDDAKCKYFTGLFSAQFEALYNFLGPAKFELNYLCDQKEKNGKGRRVPMQISTKEQMFITLLRLRRGFSIQTISYLYDISCTVVRRIFTTWIQFIFHFFKDYKFLMMPPSQELQPFLPKMFKQFRNVRCSVDCTEFFSEMPRNYSQQGNMYSSYKNHNTMKCLIAVTPNGAACFISDLFEGSIDDVTLFERCGILEHINPGDALLVDKGFTIQDILLKKQATIFIPPFLGKRSAFTKEEELLTKRIAQARIHVERFNERLKKFRLISNVIPLNLASLASQLVYVACCLVNFQPCLSK